MKLNKSLAFLFSGLLVVSVLAACTAGEDDKSKNVNSGSKTATEDSVKTTDKKPDVKNTDEIVTTAVISDQITFNAPKAVDVEKVLSSALLEQMNKSLGVMANTPVSDKSREGKNAYILSMLSFYDVGTIKVDPFIGQKLLVMTMGCDGPCYSAQILRFAWDENTGSLTMLENHSYSDYTPDFIKPIIEKTDKTFTIEALELPNNLMLADGSNTIKLQTKDVDLKSGVPVENGNKDGLTFVTLGKVAFTDTKLGPVFLSTGSIGCLFVIGPDSVVSSYTYDPGLIGNNAGASVKWNDGSDTTWLANSYEMKSGGCGIGGGCYYIESTVDADQLVEAGKTDKGVKIFLAKDTQRLKSPKELDALVDKNQPQWDLNNVYNTYLDMQEYLPEETRAATPKTYDEFLASKPIIYWQDPFGRFSGIINTEFKPPAECGKPVIYLYPKKTSLVSVKVGIQEFTKTEPAYVDGWNVIAQPNGELINLADGNKYEYLFWEGKSDKKLAMGGGSVVAKADLEEFLKVSLKQLGLNEKEAADFREFWVPKMLATAEPYILVSFAGTTEFNKIAPLSIEPKPDSLIRVFMYYQPLWQKIELPAQVLTAPIRTGFSVVEWGGTSSDGWQTK